MSRGRASAQHALNFCCGGSAQSAHLGLAHEPGASHRYWPVFDPCGASASTQPAGVGWHWNNVGTRTSESCSRTCWLADRVEAGNRITYRPSGVICCTQHQLFDVEGVAKGSLESAG